MRRSATLLFLCGAASALAQQPQGSPAPLPPPEGAPMTPALHRLIQGHGDIVRIVTGFTGLDGIVWRPEDGLTFTDPRASEIITWVPDSKTAPAVRSVAGGAAGLALDSAHHVITAQREARKITRADGKTLTTVLDAVDGAPLWGPTDLAVAPDGTVYVVDVKEGAGRVLRVLPSGQAGVLIADLAQPAGIALAPSGAALYVSDAGQAELWMYPLAGGRAGAGRRLAQILPWKAGVVGRPNGLLTDKEGHIFVAGPGGIWVLDENGGRLGVMGMPERPASCAFGDPDGRTLYIAAESSVYKVRLRK